MAIIIRGTCAVCEIPGERHVVLTRPDDPAVRIEGELCGPCGDEFMVRGEIRGWVLAPA